ncbi:MAG TPA: formate dehydrogenase accessory sulfurtransferase FdhD, partial [Candidatus Dormibacteraeota bacterium]
MAKPAAPGLRIRRFAAGEWTDAPDAVVTEEPLQLLLDGAPLAVVMRTPGADIELALGLLFAEGIIRSARDVGGLRISAEAGETEGRVKVEAVLVESNQVDVHLVAKPRRKPERSMLASSACGVCGTQMIEDLRHDLAVLPAGPRFDPVKLPGLVDKLRSGQGVFERTGGLHAAGLFDADGEVVALREDIGRHNAVDKVVGRLLLDGRLPASAMLLVVSGRAGYEIVQKSVGAGIPLLA